MFGLAQSQKMDGKSFCRNLLDLVWFCDNRLWGEVGGSLHTSIAQQSTAAPRKSKYSPVQPSTVQYSSVQYRTANYSQVQSSTAY